MKQMMCEMLLPWVKRLQPILDDSQTVLIDQNLRKWVYDMEIKSYLPQRTHCLLIPQPLRCPVFYLQCL